MQFRRILPLLGIIWIALGTSACDNDYERGGELGPIQPPEPIPATRYLDSVALGDAAASYSPEELPSGEGAAPTLTGSQWFVRGGAMVVSVEVDDSATELYVSVSRADVGYWIVPLDAPAAVIADREAVARARYEKVAAVADPSHPFVAARRAARTVTLTLQPTDSASGMTIDVRSSDGTTISAVASHAVQRNTSANSSAELQVSLNWIDPIDYDLHVTTPSGEEIYFAHRDGASGGQLDLDSNAACGIDRINNENITWGSTSPAAGEYIVELDRWSACQQPGPFPYLVTVVIGGQATTYEGTMTATESPSTIEITRFTIE